MRGIAEEKIPGGKLLRVKVVFDSSLNSVQISGDFFIHPEEAVYNIEDGLCGIGADMDENIVAHMISGIAKSGRIEMIGVSPADIARLLKKAVENGK